MSSKYQKPYTIPEGFPALLKSFTREILRAQPDNIYEFGAQYFTALLQQQNGQGQGNGADDGPSTSGIGLGNVASAALGMDLNSLSSAELEPVVLKLFLEADKDKSGYLDRQEFSHVLESSALQLTASQIRQVMAEADENEDGIIQYREFLPIMVDVLQGIRAKEQARQVMNRVDDLVRGEVENMLLHGLRREELEALMRRVFKKADADGSGLLSRREFKQALRAAELGLTRKDINLVLAHVDVDQDGNVSYEEFIPICFQVLVERFKDEILVGDILNNRDGLQGMMLEAFQAADQDESGVLSIKQLKQVLRDLSYKSLGLSTLQLVTLLCQAPTNANGLVQYVQFVPLAASIVYSMYDVDQLKLRLQAVKEAARAGGVRSMSQMDIGTLRALLEEQFRAADTEGVGQLQQEQVVAVLTNLQGVAPDMALTETHMKAIFTAIDVDESGTVDWVELVTFVCDAIEHLEREMYIQQVAGGAS